MANVAWVQQMRSECSLGAANEKIKNSLRLKFTALFIYQRRNPGSHFPGSALV